MPPNFPRSPSKKFGAIVLAAGASVRMGGPAKGLLPVHGVPAVVRMTGICSRTALAPVVVVAGAHRAAIRSALRDTDAVVVDHLDWATGRTGSIQAGLAALGAVDGTLLWPVDHPFVREGTVGELISRAEQDALAVWVVPTFEGRGGHPIVLRREMFGRVAELGPDEALRTLLARLGPQVLRAAVDDPGVVENVDTPLAYQNATERAPRGEGGAAWTGG